MSLNGNLNTLSFPDLLQLISSSKKTGVLTLIRQAQRKEIYFHEGSIVYATSSNTEEELIGNLLMRLGKLSQAQLDEVIKLHRATGKMIGATVVEMGLLKKDELIACLKLQIEEIVYNLFSWKEGEFVFQDDKEPVEGQITTNLNTMNVIMEGTRKIDEMVEMQKVLPKDDMVLRGNPNPKLDSSSSVSLSLDEFKVLLMVDGEKTYPDILEESPLGEYSTSRALLKLMDQGMVAPGERRQARKDRRKEESALLEILAQVFSTGFSIVDKIMSQKLGKVQEKLWDRVLTQKQTSFPILSQLLRDGTLVQPRDFVPRLNRLPEEVRIHQASQALQGLLSGYLALAHSYLGEDITRQITTEIKKSTASYLLKEREAVRRYALEDDLFRTLKLALKGEELV